MFKRLVRRNLVALMIPVIIIELMVLYMSMQLSLLDEYRCYKVSDLSSVGILYKEGEQNITFDYSGDIHPAGFDYVRDGEVVGSYYYSFHGNGIQLFVLNDDTYKSISSGEKVTINARLMQDEAVTGYVLSEYAKSVELSEDVFDGYVDETIINEVDYPAFKVKIVDIVQIASIALLIVSLLYAIAAFINPVLSLGFKNRGLFSSRKELIETLNNELENRLDHKERFLYITEEYVIRAYISHIYIEKR